MVWTWRTNESKDRNSGRVRRANCSVAQNQARFLSLLCALSELPYAAAAAKSLQSCLTLCDPIHGSPPGSPVPGILQARTLEWVAISFSNAWKWKVKVRSLSHVQLFATPWTVAYQAPLSMGFSRQEYWSGVPLPSLELPCKCYLIRWSSLFQAICCLCFWGWKLPCNHQIYVHPGG